MSATLGSVSYTCSLPSSDANSSRNSCIAFRLLSSERELRSHGNSSCRPLWNFFHEGRISAISLVLSVAFPAKTWNSSFNVAACSGMRAGIGTSPKVVWWSNRFDRLVRLV